MRKMFSFMITSADDYGADPGQALDWQTIDEKLSLFALAQLREEDDHLRHETFIER